MPAVVWERGAQWADNAWPIRVAADVVYQQDAAMCRRGLCFTVYGQRWMFAGWQMDDCLGGEMLAKLPADLRLAAPVYCQAIAADE